LLLQSMIQLLLEAPHSACGLSDGILVCFVPAAKICVPQLGSAQLFPHLGQEARESVHRLTYDPIR
jgi:hypothetical protein